MEKLPNDIVISFLMLIDERRSFNALIRICKRFNGLLSNDDFWRRYYYQRSGKKIEKSRREIYHLLSSQFLWKTAYMIEALNKSLTITLPDMKYESFVGSYCTVNGYHYDLSKIHTLSDPQPSIYRRGKIYVTNSYSSYILSNGEVFLHEGGQDRRVKELNREGAKILLFSMSGTFHKVCVNDNKLLVYIDNIREMELQLEWIPNKVILSRDTIILIHNNICYEIDINDPSKVLDNIVDFTWIEKLELFLTTNGDILCYTCPTRYFHRILNKEVTSLLGKKVGKVSAMVKISQEIFLITPVGEVFRFKNQSIEKLDFKNVIAVVFLELPYGGELAVVTAN